MVNEDLERLKKFNTLYYNWKWEQKAANKRHVDALGKEIHKGETYYSRNCGMGWHETYKVSKESFAIIYELLFNGNFGLNDIAGTVLTKQKQVYMKAARALSAMPLAPQVGELGSFPQIRLQQSAWAALDDVSLERLVWTKPVLALAREFGVSDVAVSKRCRKACIQTPPRGFWAKVYAGKIEHPNGEAAKPKVTKKETKR